MEEVKWVSLFLIAVTVLSGVVMTFVDKHAPVIKEKAVRRINRENDEKQ